MYPSPTIILRIFDTLLALITASILGTILLGASAVFASASPRLCSADDSGQFYFDDAGRLAQHGYGPLNSRPQPDYNAERRMQREQMSQEILRQNEALIEGYYSHKPSSPSSGYAPSTDQYLYFPSPGATPRLCQRAGQAVYCQ